MNNTSFRARSLACALLATTAIHALASAPAAAQSAGDPPPARFQIDENSVDVARGTFKTFATDISIGPADRGGLSYIRGFGSAPAGDNYDLGIYLSGGLWSASVGFNSYTFSLSGTTYTSTDGSGATLVKSGNVYTLTTGDGTVVVYDYVTPDSGDFSRKARGTSISYPSGEKISLAWVSASWCSNNLDGCAGGQIVNGVRLQAVSSSLGYQLHFNYANNNPEPLTNTQGMNWRRRTSITAFNTTVDPCDPFAATCSYSQTWPTTTYSGDNVTDPLGRTSTYSITPTGWTIKRPSSSAPNLTVTIDSNAKVSSVVRDGLTWTYAYGVSGNVGTLTVTDPLGPTHTRTITSDLTVGLPTAVKDELGFTTYYEYEAGTGRLKKAVAPEGNYVQYTYDGRGNIIQTTAVAKASSGLPNITTSAVFPATCSNVKTCNQPTSTTDARGKITDYTYDATHGGLLTATLPAATSGAVRPQTRYTYTALTAPGGPSVYKLTGISACQTLATCAGAADEAKTVIAYVHSNRLPSSVTTSSGNGSVSAITAMGYDSIGNMITVDGPLSGANDTTRYRYDAARQVVGIVWPDPDSAGVGLRHRAQRATYNLDGQTTKVETGRVDSQSDAHWAAFIPNESVETAYDTSARPMTEKLVGSDGLTYSLTQMSYDGEGRLECTAQRMNPSAFSGLPASACSPGAEGSYGPDSISKNIYNARNDVTEVRTAVGTAIEAAEVTLSYRQNGQVETLTDGENNKTTYEYDGHDRLAKTRFPVPTKGGLASSTTDYDQLGYDVASNVTSFRNRAGETLSYTYDDLDRLTFNDLPGSEPDVALGYDLLGRMKSATQPGHALSFTYDALGRKLTEVGPHGTVSSMYDSAGRRTRVTYPDGFTVDYAYSVTGDTQSIKQRVDSFTSVTLATLNYDSLGRRASLVRPNGTTTSYSYDPASRLAQIVHEMPGTTHDLTLGFNYNPSGEIVSNTRSNDSYAWTGHGSGTSSTPANGLNQIVSRDGATIGYDGRGNVTNDPSNGVNYGYSSENLLTSVSGTGWSLALAYDPLGRLYSAASNRSVYDGMTRIADYNSAGTQTNRYVHGPGMDEPLIQYGGSGLGTRAFTHADERGTIVASSNDAGTVTAFGRYDEYGKPQAFASRFGFAGMPYETVSELYFARARMYNPRLARFMQPDPIEYGGGMNMYSYVGGDPVNLVDPLGLCGEGNRRVYDTGSRVGRCVPKDSKDYGGIAPGLSGTSIIRGGGGGGRGSSYVCVSSCDVPTQAVYDSAGTQIVTVTGGRWEWVSNSLGFYLRNSRYVKNPYFQKSRYSDEFDLATGVLFAGPVLIMGGAEALALPAGGITVGDVLFARGIGLTNSNNVLRFGRNWKGSYNEGKPIYRIGIGHKTWPKIPGLTKFPWHIP
jgi:RHS repeat-associated protein